MSTGGTTNAIGMIAITIGINCDQGITASPSRRGLAFSLFHNHDWSVRKEFFAGLRILARD